MNLSIDLSYTTFYRGSGYQEVWGVVCSKEVWLPGEVWCWSHQLIMATGSMYRKGIWFFKGMSEYTR